MWDIPSAGPARDGGAAAGGREEMYSDASTAAKESVSPLPSATNPAFLFHFLYWVCTIIKSNKSNQSNRSIVAPRGC